jgi:hypothetical protein
MKYIFRQKVYELAPRVVMQKDIFGGYSYPAIEDVKTQVEDVLVCECDISEPMLKCGDVIYLHSLSEKVVVEDVVRSDDETTVCYITSRENKHHLYEFTLNNCEKVVAYGKNAKEELGEYKKQYKYKHRFFNRKSNG